MVLRLRNKQDGIGALTAVLLVIAAVAVIALLVVTQFTTTVPDLNPTTHTSGGTSSTATSYAQIKIQMDFAAVGPAGAQGLIIHAGYPILSVHEVLAPSPGPATIFGARPGTAFGEDCSAKVTLFFATPDDSGRAESPAAVFHPDSPFFLQMGNLNMFHNGTVSLTMDFYVRGCGIGSGTDWTKTGVTATSSFYFDGVDGS